MKANFKCQLSLASLERTSGHNIVDFPGLHVFLVTIPHVNALAL